MPSPEILDFAKLLAPISAEKPTGIDLRTDTSLPSLYHDVRDARNKARGLESQLMPGTVPEGDKVPDWEPILKKGNQALTEKSKDLEVAAYVTEALVRLRGFAGLRDGFRLTVELIERFWDDLHPMPDEDGMATRMIRLEGLFSGPRGGTLLTPLLQVPISQPTGTGRFTFAQAEGEKREVVRKAVGETEDAFLRTLAQDLEQCQAQLNRLTAALRQRCEKEAPSTTDISEKLQWCLNTLRELAGEKRLKEPASAGPPPDGSKGAVAPAPTPTPQGLVTREDAFRTLERVAEFFRSTEPQSLLPHALEQVVRWGKMSPEQLLSELIPEEKPRKDLFKQVGIRQEPPPRRQ